MWEKQQIFVIVQELVRLRWRCRSYDVQVVGDFPAERVQRQVVHIKPKGILQLSADGDKTQDDVCGDCEVKSVVRQDVRKESHSRRRALRTQPTDTTGNSDPLQGFDELEWQHQNVDPSNLGNSNGIGFGQRSVANPFGLGYNLSQSRHCIS
jgi:hypothetical protein